MISNQSLIIIGAAAILVFSNFKTEEQVLKESKGENQREITVTGSSEMIVQPNQMELEIIVQGQSENELEKNEKKFFDVMNENHIPTDKISFNNANSNWYWYYWWSYRNRPLLRKTYYVNLNGETDMLKLMKNLNHNWVQNVRISNTSNTEIQALRKQVKMDAIKAAKEKAEYLLNGIDEKIGRVVMVQEISPVNQPTQSNWYYYNNRSVSSFNANTVSNSSSSYTPNSGQNADIDNTQSFKLRYEILVKFEIN